MRKPLRLPSGRQRGKHLSRLKDRLDDYFLGKEHTIRILAINESDYGQPSFSNVGLVPVIQYDPDREVSLLLVDENNLEHEVAVTEVAKPGKGTSFSREDIRILAELYRLQNKEGGQFHPESILTMRRGIGTKLICNVLAYVK